MPNARGTEAPIRKTMVFGRNYNINYTEWDPNAVTITLEIEDDSGASKKIYKTLETGFEYELPKTNPFPTKGGYVFMGWSYTPNGPLITAEKITVSTNTTLYGVCQVIITLSPNEGTGDPVRLQLAKETEYTLPETPPFTAPFSTFFDGWSYIPNGAAIAETKIQIMKPLTLFPRWRTGYDGWVQLKDFNNPKTVTSLGTIYQDMSNITPYKYNGHNAFWNNIEMYAYEVTAPIVNVVRLPEYAPADVIYCITSDNTYWHFEYDLIAKGGGLPDREDTLVWEELTLINLNTPRIADNTQEVYFDDTINHCYYYDYIEKIWRIQNDTLFGLRPNYTVSYENLPSVPNRRDHVREFYKITVTVDGYSHYCWARLVDTEYHHPVRPRIDELSYWIIDSDWHLWVGNRPVLGNDILHQGDFLTQTTYGWEQGPWQQYQKDIRQVTILDDIVPVNFSHWFDVFWNCTVLEGLEHIKTDYCKNMEAVFAQHRSMTEYKGMPYFNTETVENMNFMFGEGEGPIKEIDLSGWDTRKSRGFKQFFRNNPNLEHIYVGDNFIIAPDADTTRIFDNCPKLHNWDGKVDRTHAVIDDGTNGGYFERKQVITFAPNGGSGEMKKNYALKGTTYTLPPCTFVHNFELSFLGWSLTPSGEPLGETMEVPAEDFTLYALWG